MLRHNYDRYVQKEEINTTCLPISHNGLPPYKQITPSPLSQSTKDHAHNRSVTPAALEMASLDINLTKDPGYFLHASKLSSTGGIYSTLVLKIHTKNFQNNKKPRVYSQKLESANTTDSIIRQQSPSYQLPPHPPPV